MSNCNICFMSITMRFKFSLIYRNGNAKSGRSCVCIRKREKNIIHVRYDDHDIDIYALGLALIILLIDIHC